MRAGPARALVPFVLATMAAVPGTPGAEVPPLPVERYRDVAARVSRDRLERTVRELAGFRTRHTGSPDDTAGEGIAAAARWIKEQMEKATGGGPAMVSFDEFVAVASRLSRPIPARNVMTVIPAASDWAKNRYVIISGHYDSRASDPRDTRSDAPGANDDGSGTAVVMELATILADRSFDANILLVCVAGEEQGLLGAKHLALRTTAHGWDVRAMITNDIVGNSLGQNGVREDHRLRVFSEGVRSTETAAEGRLRVSIGGENDAPSRQLSRYVAEITGAVFDDLEVLQVFRRDRMGRGGDHIPFLDRGLAAVRFTEVNEHFHHQHQDVRGDGGVRYGDLPRFMDFDYLARVARANAAIVVSLADAPAEPAAVRISPGVRTDTTLYWEPVVDRDIAGYEVLRRDTTAAVWEEARFAGPEATSLTLEGVTVDNSFFAVRAVDQEGNRSLAVFPAAIQRD